jgi:chromate reductase, NAD(P)H dehydrogenase (quinone)
MRILAVSGSLRETSYNTSLLRAALEAAPDGVELELWEGLAELPLYDEDLDGIVAGKADDDHRTAWEADAPESVRRLRADWDAADAILFSTPEYNGSVPGGLKNAIDWASRPRAFRPDGAGSAEAVSSRRLEAVLRNKPVAVVGASTGQFGALWAQQDLKRILGIAGARVVGTEIPVARAHERFDSEGRLLDGEVFEQLRLHLTTLASEAVAAPERVAA